MLVTTAVWQFKLRFYEDTSLHYIKETLITYKIARCNEFIAKMKNKNSWKVQSWIVDAADNMFFPFTKVLRENKCKYMCLCVWIYTYIYIYIYNTEDNAKLCIYIHGFKIQIYEIKGRWKYITISKLFGNYWQGTLPKHKNIKNIKKLNSQVSSLIR